MTSKENTDSFKDYSYHEKVDKRMELYRKRVDSINQQEQKVRRMLNEMDNKNTNKYSFLTSIRTTTRNLALNNQTFYQRQGQLKDGFFPQSTST